MIDKYGRTKKCPMNASEVKRRIADHLIIQLKPQIMIELGEYVRYFTILFGDFVRHAGGQRYLSLKCNRGFCSRNDVSCRFGGAR